MATYEDTILDHDIDGIREYDNPLPGWLMAIWWGSLVFAVLYIAYYALAFGPATMEAEYRGEQVAARAEVQSYYDAHPLVPPTAAELLLGAATPEVLDLGAERFAKTCASCHGDHAQGLIGPNLTDEYWIHGGTVTQIFTTVAKGVPAKGMPPWGRALPPEEVAAVVSYVRSRQGTKPANPKKEEGDRVTPEPIPAAGPKQPDAQGQ